jgi:hypothetical protein
VKQRLEPSDLEMLTPEQREWLRKRWKPQVGDKYLDSHGDLETYVVAVYTRAKRIKGMNEMMTGRHNALPLLSVGQMIELLSDILRDDAEPEWQVQKWFAPDGVGICADNLCNELWQACLAVIPKEEVPHVER